MKKIISNILAITMMLTIGGTSIITSADEIRNPVNEIDYEQIEKFYEENDIPEEKQKLLTEKLENGIQWDSSNPEKLKEVPDDFSYLKNNDISQSKTYIFDDGSIIKISVEPVETTTIPEIAPLKAGEATTDSFGTFYHSCRFSRTYGGVTASVVLSAYRNNYGASTIYTVKNSENLYNDPTELYTSGFGNGVVPTGKVIRDKEYNGNAALYSMTWQNTKTLSASWRKIGGSTSVGSTQFLHVAFVNSNVFIDSELPG